MSPKVKLKSMKIITDINNLSFAKRHNKFVLNAYKNEVEKFINNIPENANEILGVIAALEKNIDQLHYFHKLAVNLGSDKAQSYFNYAISLMKLGFISESIEKATNVFGFNKLHVDNNNILIKHNLCIGDFSNAIKYLNHWNALYKENRYLKTDLINDAYDILEKSNTSQNVLMQFIDGILKIFQREKVYIENCDVEIVGDKKSHQFLKLKYIIDIEYEPLLNIEDKIYEYLLQAPKEIRNIIMIDIDTEDPRLEEFILYLNNYESDNQNCFKELDSDKMDYIAKLIQVNY